MGRLAGAGASRAEGPAGRASVGIGRVWGKVVGAGGDGCGMERVWLEEGECVGELLRDDTRRAWGSSRCDSAESERGPSMTVSRLLSSLLSVCG